MEDKSYIADPNKSKLAVDYISGEKVEHYVEPTYFNFPRREKAARIPGQETQNLLGGIYAGISERVQSGAA